VYATKLAVTHYGRRAVPRRVGVPVAFSVPNCDTCAGRGCLRGHCLGHNLTSHAAAVSDGCERQPLLRRACRYAHSYSYGLAFSFGRSCRIW